MNRLQKQPTFTYVPGIPGVAAQPAYCVTKRVFAGYKEVSAGGEGYFVSIAAVSSGAYLPPGASPVYRQDGYSQVLTGYFVAPQVVPRTVPIYRNVVECYPATEAVVDMPARLDAGDSEGWNAGARSIASLPVNGYFQCVIPAADLNGVVVGLSDGSADNTFAHAKYALAFRPSGVTPVAYGRALGPEVAFPFGSIVRFERDQRQVRAYVAGALIHTYDTPSTGMLYGDVALYGLYDYVDTPSIGELPAGVDGGPSPALGVVSADAYSSIDGVSTPADGMVSGSTSTGINAGYSGAHGLVGSDVINGIFGWPGSATGELVQGEPDYVATGIVGIAASAQMSAYAAVGVLTAIDGAAAGHVGLAGSEPYCAIYGEWGSDRTMTAWQSNLPEGEQDGTEVLFAFDYSSLASVLMFMSYEQVTVGETVDLVLMTSMEAYEALLISEYATLGGVISMLGMERVLITGTGHAGGQEAVQYAVNVITGALSEYRNFGFKQFARMSGDTYAITDSGLYRLGGEGDDGQTLNAAIDFGSSDFGTSRSKRVNSVYAGISTDGGVYIRVSADDGEEAIYRAIGDGVEQRVRTAKGLVGRHWRVRLELADASYADLDNIEIEIGVSQRRTRR